MSELRVFIVDDEQPARKKLRRFLKDDGETIVVGEAANGEEAIRGIRETSPDLLLLDVQMQGMDGFDVVRGLDAESLPRIVFVTAHDQYAMQAFDVHAFGYLLKPFDRARFQKVLGDAKKELARHREREGRAGDISRLLAELDRRRTAPRRILVHENDRAVFLSLDEVDWIEADRNYLILHTGARTHTLRGTIDGIEQKLDAAHFIRLNRSTLARIDFIRELQKWFHGEYKVILRNGVTVTWTRRYVGRHPELLSAALS